MKQTVQFQLGQSLSITPQLQQAIRLLQLSTVELQQEVQELLESNIMLETEAEGQERDAIHQEIEQQNLNDQPTNNIDENMQHEATDAGQLLDLERTNLTEELPIDSDWSDSYDDYTPGNGNKQAEYNDDIITQSANYETLRDYLNWQLNLLTYSEKEHLIGTAIIDSIDEDGYLTSSLEDIIAGLKDFNLNVANVLPVLYQIQDFDPPGVGARNLQECLYIQLQQIPEDTVAKRHAIEVCKKYFDLLSQQKYAELKEATSMQDDDLQAMMQLLRTLNPFPGTKAVKHLVQYVTPDVIVSKRFGTWHVELNPEIIPRLRIN
ncbi:hypothetical protein TI03_00045, partial [Achromatium sp. WMS1]